MIELLKENDMESYIKLIKESFGYETDKVLLTQMMKHSRILVIKDEKKIVASATISIIDDYIQNKKRFHLDYVCVDKDYRRRHLATKLLNHIYCLANRENIDIIELTSSVKRKEANMFYKREGFIIKDSYIFLKEL